MNKNLRKMVTAGLFAAMIFVFTYFIKVPVASGYVHLGDALIYVCACIIGGPWAILAGAIGEGLADLVGGYAAYAPATIIVKALIALPFIFTGAKKEKILTPATALMTVPAGLITVGGYFIADLIIDKSYAIVDIPGNIIQAVGSAVLFVIIAAAFDAVKIKSKISLK
ncbi:MAG: ECF transporter S component [Clostridiales bacterium]|nr:ECF transporter S component [Clostridiales bacterium]